MMARSSFSKFSTEEGNWLIVLTEHLADNQMHWYVW